MTAAAPIHPDLIRWLHAIGLPVLELYGQSEDCGPTTANRPDSIKIGTVGLPILGGSVRIADDGEILVKGGDLGSVDNDGFVRITGRKKDLIITAAGKNIAPQEIEVNLRYHPFISHAVVIGEGRRYLTALITLDPDVLNQWAQVHSTLGDLETLAVDPDVHFEVQTVVDEVNAMRSRAESIRKFRVLPHDFTVAEGDLTPTLKVKRNVVNTKYAEIIEEMYIEEE